MCFKIIFGVPQVYAYNENPNKIIYYLNCHAGLCEKLIEFDIIALPLGLATKLNNKSFSCDLRLLTEIIYLDNHGIRVPYLPYRNLGSSLDDNFSLYYKVKPQGSLDSIQEIWQGIQKELEGKKKIHKNPIRRYTF